MKYEPRLRLQWHRVDSKRLAWAALLFATLLLVKQWLASDTGLDVDDHGRQRSSSLRALSWGFLGYNRDAGPDVQYRRIISRLERLTSELSEHGRHGRSTAADGDARVFARDSPHDASSLNFFSSGVRRRNGNAGGAAAEPGGHAVDSGGSAAPSPEDGRAPSGILPYVPQPVGRKWFITYGDARFNTSKARLAGEAAAFRVFDTVRAFGPEDLPLEFVQRNYAVLSQERGGGFWLWKPYVVWATLEAMAEGDVLMYADAGCTFLADPSPYIQLAGRFGMVAFRVPHAMGAWTKGYAFAALGMDIGLWASEMQVVAGILLLQKRPFTSFLVAEWLRLAQDERLITDVDTTPIVPNHPSFVDHRHDQSLWSLLVHKYGAQAVLNQRHFPPESARIIAATRRQE